MGKMMRVLGIVCVVLVAGVANASLTYTDTVPTVYNQSTWSWCDSTDPGVLHGSPPYYRYWYTYEPYNGDFEYDHDITGDLPPGSTITGVELRIRAWEVGPEQDQISADGSYVGDLVPAVFSPYFTETSFTLPTSTLGDNVVHVLVGVDGFGNDHGHVYPPIGYSGMTPVWSKLIVTYEPYQEPVIPAPGAILLGGLGTCLVGWLKRRQRV